MKGSSSQRGRSSGRGALSVVAGAPREIDDSPAHRAFRRADYEQCRELLEIGAASTPEETVKIDLLRARLAAASGDPEASYAAAKRAMRATEGGPTHLVASALAGSAAARLGKDREAAKLFETVEAALANERPVSVGEAVTLLAQAALDAGNYDRAERLANRNLTARVDEAESLAISGAIEIARGRYTRALPYLGAALDAVSASASPDERLRANLVRDGIIAAAETIDLTAGQRFRRDHAAVSWKPSLAAARFMAMGGLAELSLLEGDVESAWAIARDAVAYATTPAARALAETNAARTSALIGDTNGALLQFRRAWQILRSEKWSADDDAAKVALAVFAAEAAPRLTTESRKALALLATLSGKDEKAASLDALDTFAAARVGEAGGNIDRSIGLYERALEIWSDLDFRTHAAMAALDLRRITGDDAYLDAVDVALERAPKAWFRHEAQADDGPLGQLTHAERGVLLELLHGKSTREIAEESGRSEYTISNHTRKIFTAFDVHSRSRLLARCVELGITEETIERGTRPIAPVLPGKRR